MVELTADRIIKLLEEPTEDGYSIKLRITEEGSEPEIVQALQQATIPLTREILCDILGDRLEKAAVPMLIQCLHDPSEGVRASAADGLGRIGDPVAGSPLFERFADAAETQAVRTSLAAGLGSTRHKPAVPLLVDTLLDKAEVMRACASWALGTMSAVESIDALRRAVLREKVPTDHRFSEPLAALELAIATTTSMERKEAIQLLLATLKRKPMNSVQLTNAMWALGTLRAKEGVKPLERVLTKHPKGYLAEHTKAALAMIQSVGAQSVSGE